MSVFAVQLVVDLQAQVVAVQKMEVLNQGSHFKKLIDLLALVDKK